MVFSTVYNFSGFKIVGLSAMALPLGVVVIMLGRSKHKVRCSCCGRVVKKFEGSYGRCVRHLDLSGFECYLYFEEYKLHCKCGYRGYEDVGFVRSYSNCTRSYEAYVARLCDVMSLKEAASIVGLDWKTVKSIDKESIRSVLKGLSEEQPVRIGVDEIAYQKGHKYLTVVRDVDRRRVLWVGLDRKKETLDSFFRELGPEKCARIKVVVMDMWDPYIASVKEYTGADLVFDKFHVAKKVNEALDSVRKHEFTNADKNERKEFKKKRFLILRRNENVPDDKRETLSSLLEKNQTLYQAYLLKEQLLNILDEKFFAIAVHRLETWKTNVRESGLQEFQKVLKTIDNYLYGIHNYFKHGVTNAASEGFNNKIGLIKRRAYGYRDIEYFMLKIIKICGH